MPNNDFLTYNALDAACTLEIHNACWSDLHPSYEPAYQMTIDLFEPLMFMQTRGLKVNMTALEATKVDVLKSAGTKQEELNKLCGRTLNVNSPKDCQNYFYIELGIPPYYNEGSVTVDDLALQRLARGTAKRSGLRQAKLVQEIRGLQKLHGTYLDLEFDADNRMRCSYNPRGTKFGRLSSSKTVFGTGTNQQNLPQEFKKFLESDGIFIEVDKRQAEWVVVAYLTGDANMISIVESGKDAHIHTAALMLEARTGIPYDEGWDLVRYEDKLTGSNTDADAIEQIRLADSVISKYHSVLPRTMSARQFGKKSNHGLNYDEGPNKFALINEIEPNEGKIAVELYHTIYPGIRMWYESVKRLLQRDRTLTNCFGRRVRFMDAWGPDMWKAAYSMLPQSTVVDSLNQGMVRIYHDNKVCASDRCNVSLAAQVHDSILLDFPNWLLSQEFAPLHIPDIFDRLLDYTSPELCYNNRKFKIATDMKIGKNWGSYHKDRNPLGMRELKDVKDLSEILGDILSCQASQKT